MGVTYGERMLAEAETRARSSRARRRMLAVFAPAMIVTMWALRDLLSARHARLVEDGAGLFRTIVDPFLPLVWTIGLVAIPFFLAVRARAVPAGALLALVAGPVLSPSLFGPGGWRPWQIALFSALSVLVVAGARERARRS